MNKYISIILAAYSFVFYYFIDWFSEQNFATNIFSDDTNTNLIGISFAFCFLALSLFIEFLFSLVLLKKKTINLSMIPVSYMFINLTNMFLKDYYLTVWQQSFLASLHTLAATAFVKYYQKQVSDNSSPFEKSVISFLLSIFGGFIGFVLVLITLTGLLAILLM